MDKETAVNGLVVRSVKADLIVFVETEHVRDEGLAGGNADVVIAVVQSFQELGIELVELVLVHCAPRLSEEMVENATRDEASAATVVFDGTFELSDDLLGDLEELLLGHKAALE